MSFQAAISGVYTYFVKPLDGEHNDRIRSVVLLGLPRGSIDLQQQIAPNIPERLLIISRAGGLPKRLRQKIRGKLFRNIAF